MDEAFASLTLLGYYNKETRDAIREFLKVYGDGNAHRHLVEENNYKLVINKIIESQDAKMEEHGVKKKELNLDVRCDMVQCIELGHLDPSTGPKRRPCYGWISDDEDIDPCIELSQLNPSSSIMGRRPYYGWKSEDEVLFPSIEFSQSSSMSWSKRRPCYGWISEDEDFRLIRPLIRVWF